MHCRSYPDSGGVGRPTPVPGELRSLALPTHCEDKKRNVLNTRTAYKLQKKNSNLL